MAGPKFNISELSEEARQHCEAEVLANAWLRGDGTISYWNGPYELYDQRAAFHLNQRQYMMRAKSAIKALDEYRKKRDGK